MKTYTLEVLADDELVASILDDLHKRKLIRFAVSPARWSAPPASATELAERLAAAQASPRLSFEEARHRLGQ